MIRIVTQDGRDIAQGIGDILKKIADHLRRESGRKMTKVMLEDIKQHVQQKYPGSKHWSPDKVQGSNGMSNVGVVNVNIPGAGRAYHDVTILPVRARHLTIPMHQSAYGKKVSDFNDLFRPKGKNALARIDESGNLVWMFALAEKAFQKRDSSLMPSDDKLAGDIFDALIKDFK